MIDIDGFFGGDGGRVEVPSGFLIDIIDDRDMIGNYRVRIFYDYF